MHRDGAMTVVAVEKKSDTERFREPKFLSLPSLVQAPDKVSQPNVEGIAEVSQFRHVDSALAPFTLAQERLRHPQLVRQGDLGQAGFQARLPEQLEERLVIGAMNRLFHAGTHGIV